MAPADRASVFLGDELVSAGGADAHVSAGHDNSVSGFAETD